MRTLDGPNTTLAMPGADRSGLAGPPGVQLQCLEVWGGNAPVDTAVCVTGMDAYLLSESVDGGAGGDVYLASMCACANISRFVLADVVGHGPAAATLAVRLRRLMRRHINTPDQSRLARSLNTDFLRVSPDVQFATALMATFLPRTRHLVMCSAGHPRPLCYRASTRAWDFLPAVAEPPSGDVLNLPFGVIPGTCYEQFSAELRPGDLVLAYTDGLTEARGPDGNMLRETGLLDLVRDMDVTQPMEFIPGLRRALQRFAHESPIEDDLSLLLLSPNGGQPPRQSLGQKLVVGARALGLLRPPRRSGGIVQGD